MIELYVITALIAVIFFAISSILTKYLIPMSGGPYAFFILNLTFGIGLIFPLTIILYGFNGLIIPSIYIIGTLFLISLFAFLGYTSLLIGFQKGNVSVGGIVLSSRVFISVPLGFFLVGEKYESIIYLLLLLSLLGSIMVSWSRNLSILDVIRLKAPGIKWFIITSFFWAISNFFTRHLDRQLDIGIFLLYRQIFMIVLGYLFFSFGRRNFDQGEIKLSKYLISRILAYLAVLLFAQFCFVYSLGYSLTVSEGIGISEGLFTLIFSLIVARFIDNSVLNEPLDRSTLFIRFLGALIAGISTLMVILLV